MNIMADVFNPSDSTSGYLLNSFIEKSLFMRRKPPLLPSNAIKHRQQQAFSPVYTREH